MDGIECKGENSRQNLHLTTTVIPLLFIAVCPSFVMLLWYTNFYLNGSFDQFRKEVTEVGLLSLTKRAWVIQLPQLQLACCYIAAFIALQWVLTQFIPGNIIQGPPDPKGVTPEYKCNGMLCFLITMVIFLFCSSYYNSPRPAWFYDNFGAVLMCLMLFGCTLCTALYIKGLAYRDSHGVNPIFDYYWGSELHPQLLGCDVKVFTNCRMGMTLWAIFIICFAHKQYELDGRLADSMAVSLALQLLYILKFFRWEAGYFSSTDIAHDRAGFYICWGCMVWVPALYTSTSFYLTAHPNTLDPILSSALLFVGTMSIIITMDADEQKLLLRQTRGDCTIWRQPAEYITAIYTIEGNPPKRQRSKLLISGWWGISRHFHYITELLTALCWSLPALFDNYLPYVYLLFLVLLLAHRIHRIESRCTEKYGEQWNEYCRRVPYVILPYVF